ncbi:MAG: iron-containing alcohol dehydrogenase [Candidatus Helarchaeota archaeon]|nr:iron-containing alcohol dehydrogenase [Candidatus Helarchaeota archaeon]
MQFDLLSTPLIFFGSGKIQNIGEIIKNFGSRVLIVGSESALKSTSLNQILADQTIDFTTFIVKGEPTIELIDRGAAEGLNFKAQVVIGLGGGSALDAGKAIAGLMTNGGSGRDYMEVIGKGLKIMKPASPYIAVPTTAGTGTEVTKNAVIKSPADGYKASIRSPLLVPKIALIDPSLTLSVSPKVTASTGLDALTQLIEAYTSNKSQPVTDALALVGIQKAKNSLLTAYRHGDNLSVREDMALAALLSGICLANAGLGAVHGFASPLGGLFPIPHGVVCAALLASVVEQNIQELKNKSPNAPVLAKYAKLGELVAEKPLTNNQDAYQGIIRYLKELTESLKIPSFSEFGVTEADLPRIIEKAKKSSSIRYNPIALTDDALHKILSQAL